MSQVRTGSEPNAATLVGSLASFPLLDVLDLLARTGRAGELQVIGPGLDRRIWVDRGDLVESLGSGTPGSGLFEMACIEDGWFYFTLTPTPPEATERTALDSIIDGLAPQVTEWHTLVALFPFDAMVRMSTSTPAEEVQIRADQWQILSLIGAGRQVREVLVASSLHPLDTLRTLRELTTGFLVSVDSSLGVAHLAETDPGVALELERPLRPVAVEVEPEPPAVAELDPDTGPVPDGPGSVPEPDPESEPNLEPEPAMVAHAEDPATSEAAAIPPDFGVGTPTERIHSSVMPPPISGDPWSSPTRVSRSGQSNERT